MKHITIFLLFLVCWNSLYSQVKRKGYIAGIKTADIHQYWSRDSCGSPFRDSIIEILEKKKVIKTLSYEDVIYLFGDTPYRILYNEGKTLKLSYDIWGGFDENLNRCRMPPAKVLELFIDTKTNTISYHGVFEE